MKHKHAALMLQYAQDAQETETPWKRWEVFDGKWRSLITNPTWAENFDYRRKPRTININGIEVPEPMREAPEDGTCLYMTYLGGDNSPSTVWEGDAFDLRALELGLCHMTREAAALHAKAIISFTKK